MTIPGDIPKYGVAASRPAGDEIDSHIEDIEYLGFAVVESGLSDARLNQLGESLDRDYARQVAEAERDGSAMAADSDIVRCPLAYDDIYLDAATAAPLIEICRRMLGPHFVLLQQNGLINRPATREYQSRWHRDLPYQHFVASKKIALNALLCIEPFTEETGGTLVLPGSHLFEEFPSDRYVRLNERVANAKAGSLLVLDSMLFHRAGYNKSNRNRRGINHLIGRPFMAQQIDMPRLLDGRHCDNEFLGAYLGYRWNPASSVSVWRKQRLSPTT